MIHLVGGKQATALGATPLFLFKLISLPLSGRGQVRGKLKPAERLRDAAVGSQGKGAQVVRTVHIDAREHHLLRSVIPIYVTGFRSHGRFETKAGGQPGFTVADFQAGPVGVGKMVHTQAGSRLDDFTGAPHLFEGFGFRQAG